MDKKIGNKGFTLIEVIVSIAIGSIVLGVVLSIIVTSFNIFGSLSTSYLKKKSLDNIMSYVREELLNAHVVVISEKKPKGDDWKWLYVDNDMLYRGTNSMKEEAPFLSYDYYNKHSLTDNSSKANKLAISLTVFRSPTDNFRAKFSYVLSNNDEKYSKEDTIKFSNIKASSSTSSYDGDITKITSDKQDYVLSNTLKLYYKGAKSSNSTDHQKGSYTHTIVDKLNIMNTYLNRGYYVLTSVSNGQDENTDYFELPTNNSYRLGDFAYYEGYWWMKVKNDTSGVNNPPQATNGDASWQRLDENFTPASTYLKGDVIKYNNYYYQCNANKTSYQAPGSDNSIWKLLGDASDLDTTTPGYDTSFTGFTDDSNTTSLGALFNLTAPSTSPINDESRTSLPNYKTYSIKYDNVPIYDSNTFNTANYKVGSLIQVKVKGSDGGRGEAYAYYRLYKKIYEPDALENNPENKAKLAPGGSFMSGWKLLENEYMPNSSYAAGDAMRIATSGLNTDGNEDNYIQFLQKGKITESFNVQPYYYKYSKIFMRSTYYNQPVDNLGTKSSIDYVAYKNALINPYSIVVNNKKEIVSGNYYSDFNGRTTLFWTKRSMIYNMSATNVIQGTTYVNYPEVPDPYGANISLTVDNDAMMNTYWTRVSVNDLNKNT